MSSAQHWLDSDWIGEDWVSACRCCHCRCCNAVDIVVSGSGCWRLSIGGQLGGEQDAVVLPVWLAGCFQRRDVQL